MSLSDRIWDILEHMLEDAQDVVDFAKKAGSLEVFADDVMLKKAIAMSLLNIGELANKLPFEYRSKYPEIPWKLIIGMRNAAAHGYHKLEVGTVWNATQVYVPQLITFLKQQVQEMSEICKNN